jgi:hypothetical protein
MILTSTNSNGEIPSAIFNQILADDVFKVAKNAMIGVISGSIIKPVNNGLISTNQVYGSGLISISFDLIYGNPAITIRRAIILTLEQDQTDVLDIYLPYASPTIIPPKLKMLPTEYRKVREDINMLIQQSISYKIDVGIF